MNPKFRPKVQPDRGKDPFIYLFSFFGFYTNLGAKSVPKEANLEFFLNLGLDFLQTAAAFRMHLVTAANSSVVRGGGGGGGAINLPPLAGQPKRRIRKIPCF